MYNKIKTFTQFLSKTQNTILSAAFILAVSSGINAVLGILKGRLLAKYFGVSSDLAIFLTADKIPSLVYSVLIVGAISTVFIPIFTNYVKQDKQKAFDTASAIINSTLGLFALIATILVLFSEQVFNLVSLGKFSAENIFLGANLMKVLLLGQLILVISSMVTSLLQSFKFFIIPALAPVLYNLGMIIGIILFSKTYGIYAPALGTCLGGLMHLAIQIPLLKKTGYKYKLKFDFRDKGLYDIANLIPPRIVSVFMANIIGLVSNSLALTISSASSVYLRFALQLQTFPVTLFGMSMSSASLPTLSAYSDEKNREKFKKALLTTLLQTLFLVVPLSIILFVLRIPAIRLVYGVKNFPWEATILTAKTLAFFSVSIFAQSSNYLLTRAFYSLRDTKTPVLISITTTFINIFLSYVFTVILKLDVWSIALAFSITSIIDSIVLTIALSNKIGGLGIKDLLIPFFKISLAGILMGITLYLPLKILDIYVFDTSKTLHLLLVTAVAGVCGSFTYLLFTKLLKVQEVELLYKLLRKLNLKINLSPIVQNSENNY